MLKPIILPPTFNKINESEHQNLELGILTHTFHKFWYKHIFPGHKHKYMEKFTEKVLFDAYLRKAITKTPINSTQPGQNTTEEQSRSSP